MYGHYLNLYYGEHENNYARLQVELCRLWLVKARISHLQSFTCFVVWFSSVHFIKKKFSGRESQEVHLNAKGWQKQLRLVCLTASLPGFTFLKRLCFLKNDADYLFFCVRDEEMGAGGVSMQNVRSRLSTKVKCFKTKTETFSDLPGSRNKKRHELNISCGLMQK